MYIELKTINGEIINFENSFGSNLFQVDYKTVVSIVAFDLDKRPDIKKQIESVDMNTSISFLESIITGGFVIVLIENGCVRIFRDPSGIKTAYYKIEQNKILFISSNAHKIAKKSSNTTISKSIVDQLLYSEFVIDGNSIYTEIFEFKKGCKYILNQTKGKIEVVEEYKLALAKNDNTLSFDENKIQLKESILNSHIKSAGSENIIYLSGGIDSCVMLAALDEVVQKNSIQNITYFVKGTSQDETVYAKKAAKYLGYDCEVIEVDPHADVTIENLENRILEYNNPYIGLLIFKPHICSNAHYFAGQDTRLHTPDINALTNWVFNRIIKNNQINTDEKSRLGTVFLKQFYSSSLAKSKSRYFRNLEHIVLSVLSKEDYLSYILLKNSPIKSRKFDFDVLNNSERDNHFAMNTVVESKRHLYNLIVEKKWDEQYTDDIKYMLEMGVESNNYTQMPFYNLDLARFSSSIPFKYGAMYTEGTAEFSNNKVKVNKKLLRAAFDGQISPDVLYRKKAVSLTVSLIFNGKLGNIILKEINRDLDTSDSIIREFNYLDFVQRFRINQNWIITDQHYLLRIFYLYTILIYQKNLL